jgi:hypothetical protein
MRRVQGNRFWRLWLLIACTWARGFRPVLMIEESKIRGRWLKKGNGFHTPLYRILLVLVKRFGAVDEKPGVVAWGCRNRWRQVAYATPEMWGARVGKGPRGTSLCFPKSRRDMDVPSFSYPTALQLIALKES